MEGCAASAAHLFKLTLGEGYLDPMKNILALCLALLLLSGCGGVERSAETIYAMDTVMTVTVYAETGDAQAALLAAEEEINRLDALLSISDEKSDIYLLNQKCGGAVSEETYGLLQRALDIAELTGGDYDPTVYPLMEAWGFRSGEYRVPTQTELTALLSKVGHERVCMGDVVSLPEGGGMDLGGIAKGYTSEQVLGVLAAEGVGSAVISLGGNVGTLGRKPDGSPWVVAIRDPEGEESSYIATLRLGQAEGCVYAITSGGYERYFEQDGTRYHHILDPKTGYPAETDLRSVTIVSQDGTLADALSTAMFVKGFDGAVDFWRQHAEEFGMVLVTEDGIYATSGLEISAEQTVHILEVTP